MRAPILICGLLASACAIDGESLGSASQAAWGCGSMCGQNGKIIDVPFHELHLKGLPNVQGTTLVGALDAEGKKVALSAEEGVLYGTAPGGEPAPLEKGSAIIVSAYDSSLGAYSDFHLHIAAISKASYWVPGSLATTYRMTYSASLGGPQRELCPPAERSENIPSHHFVALTGDRYDSETATVTIGDGAAGWLTFGCSGSAISKVHLARHTEVGSGDETTLEQRQALLKMYVADYCGDGTSYTQTGHPLRYIDDLAWLEGLNWDGDLGSIDSIEAIWEQHGARCLDVPRMVEADKVHCIDELPSCRPVLADWEASGHLLSANPL